MKFPSLKFSLPKLGGLFGRKGARADADEDDLEDLEQEMRDGIDVDASVLDLPEGETEDNAGAPTPSSASEGSDEAPDGDFEDLEDLDDFDEDESAASGGRKRLIIIGGAVAFVLTFVIGGAGWFLFAGGDPAPVAENAGADLAGDQESRQGQFGMVERTQAIKAPPAGPEGVPRAIATLPPRGSAGLMTPSGGVAPNAPVAGTTLEGGIGVEDPQLGLVVAAATPASFVGVPDLPVADPLPSAPIAGLVEEGPHGMLPRVGSDGRAPYQAYARPFTGAADLIRVAIIVKELGLSRATTNAAIRKLPPEVTMAFSPYAQGVADWARFARERGHETLMELPLEPREFPVLDPGPYALRTLADPADNQRLLEFTMGRGVGYVGLLGVMGSKYSENKEQLSATLSQLKARGLMYVDGSNGEKSLAPGIAKQINLPRAIVDVDLDRVSSRARVAEHLARVEEVARKKAVAVLAVDPTPIVIEALVAWIKELEAKGLVLAPVSALADKQLF